MIGGDILERNGVATPLLVLPVLKHARYSAGT